MYYIYHYVPNCKKCNSARTGYYIPAELINQKKINKHLKRAEYIACKDYENGRTCFCLDCGVSWKGEVTPKLVTKKFLHQESVRKGTHDLQVNESFFLTTQPCPEKKTKKKEILREKSIKFLHLLLHL